MSGSLKYLPLDLNGEAYNSTSSSSLKIQINAAAAAGSAAAVENNRRKFTGGRHTHLDTYTLTWFAKY